jgi:hypothetical protein
MRDELRFAPEIGNTVDFSEIGSKLESFLGR